jgi:peptidoglycan hydrolase-like protein with peptidoglycan-binding domain
MEQASRNAPPLGLGSSGAAVALLQGALIDLGEQLPESVKKTGGPDGRFGVETKNAVISYQSKKKTLTPDGIAGMYTIKALDEDMVKATTVVIPSPPPQTVVISTPHYAVGSGDPPLGHDPGAGTWNSKKTEATYVALKLAILNVLPEAYVIIGDDATKHMAHYLGNSGRSYTIDLEDMVEDVPSARARYEDEVAQAQELVERLPAGTHNIHSLKAENGYNYQAENRNWFFAIGGYSKWGEGVAKVQNTPTGMEYELDFVYKFFDRYNWDAGKSVTFAGITITDRFMGEFHRQGLAKEFDCRGSFKRHFTWKKGGAIPQQQLYARGGR